MIELRTPIEIRQMQAAGSFVAEVLSTTSAAAAVGVNLLELDALAHSMIRDRRAKSCYIDYHPSFGGSPFGKVICTSVNDAALHGLPYNYPLADGDLLSLDFAAQVDGWVADSAITVVVGAPRDEDLHLVKTTERCLRAGIAAAQVGGFLSDISSAIGQTARKAGYSVNTSFGGHGVGRIMHGDPHIPNDGPAGLGPKIEAGLVVAIEPWLMHGTDSIYTDADGWTLRSADGSRAAHSEHTIAVTTDGPLVLTAR